MSHLTVATFNLASGRDGNGVHLAEDRLRSALTALDADVVSLQEVDVGQPRSHGVHQAAAAARALAAPHWCFAPTLAGTPSPLRTWHRLPPALLGDEPATRPVFGNALLSRVPVRAWHVLGLGTGRGRLPVRAPHPVDGSPHWWWVPDEPRVALAAELDGVTVVGTHLSFAPLTSVRQLRLLRSWTASLPGHVVVAGDLNLPGPVPARLLAGRSLVRGATYPAPAPRVQLDHVVGGSALQALATSGTRRLHVGDHLAVVAHVTW